METILKRRPDTLEALKEVPGFGELKVSKYGLDILKILNEEKI